MAAAEAGVMPPGADPLAEARALVPMLEAAGPAI